MASRSTSAHSLHSPGQLRLVYGTEQGANELSERMTLAEFFDFYFLPSYLLGKKRDPKTIAGYRTAIRRWQELTGDPPLRQIEQLTCAEFVQKDLELSGQDGPISPNTVRSHLRYLQLVLDLAGPKTMATRRTAATDDGLFGLTRRGVPRLPPHFDGPDERPKPAEDSFTLEEIRAVIAAADKARAPFFPSIRPGRWWAILIRTLYNSDLRIGSAMDLRGEWIARIGDWAYVCFPGGCYKGGLPTMIFLSPSTLAAIDSLPWQTSAGSVFRWPHTLASLHRVWREDIVPAAGVRPFAFHALRKSGLTELWETSPEAAQKQAGHRDGRTTRKHYIRPATLARGLAKLIGPAAAAIPQP
jgi:integrase